MERSEGVGGGLRAGEARHRARGGSSSRASSRSATACSRSRSPCSCSRSTSRRISRPGTRCSTRSSPRTGIIAYGISFAVLGKLWLAHHFFAAVERFDPVLMGLNLLYLAWIVWSVHGEVLGEYVGMTPRV